MTGRHPTHTGIVCNFLEMNPREYCIAEVFRDSGYDTGFIGKWHLSAGRDRLVGKHNVTPADRERIFKRTLERLSAPVHGGAR